MPLTEDSISYTCSCKVQPSWGWEQLASHNSDLRGSAWPSDSAVVLSL